MLEFNPDNAAKILLLRREQPACLSFYEKRVGGLSKPSKMPWYSWSISATECKVGSALRDVPGSVCSNCYAMKGRYVFPKVRAALSRRLACYLRNPETWAAYMVLLLEGKAKGKLQYFRWFDSGDVQGLEMLQAIVWIAHQLPHIRFWLPTKEYGLFKRPGVQKLVASAQNLTVRISAPMIGQYTPMEGYVTSTVGVPIDSDVWMTDCPAKDNNGKCGDCRACWSKRHGNVNYPEH